MDGKSNSVDREKIFGQIKNVLKQNSDIIFAYIQKIPCNILIFMSFRSNLFVRVFSDG